MRNAHRFWFMSVGLAAAGVASAGGVIKPTAATFSSLPLAEVPRVEIPEMDLGVLAAIEQAEQADGLPARFALEQPVLMTPDTHGVWEQVDADTVMWRLLHSSGSSFTISSRQSKFSCVACGGIHLRFGPTKKEIHLRRRRWNSPFVLNRL